MSGRGAEGCALRDEAVVAGGGEGRRWQEVICDDDHHEDEGLSSLVNVKDEDDDGGMIQQKSKGPGTTNFNETQLNYSRTDGKSLGMRWQVGAIEPRIWKVSGGGLKERVMISLPGDSDCVVWKVSLC